MRISLLRAPSQLGSCKQRVSRVLSAYVVCGQAAKNPQIMIDVTSIKQNLLNFCTGSWSAEQTTRISASLFRISSLDGQDCLNALHIIY